jgi:uncharacterized protein
MTMRATWQIFFRCVFAFLAVVVSATAVAQSFDCKLARTGVEKLICADKALAGLDARIAISYQRALKAHDGQIADYVRRDQRAFQAMLRAIDKPQGDIEADCPPKDAACLKRLLEIRIDALDSQAYIYGGVYKRADGTKLLITPRKSAEFHLRVVAYKPTLTITSVDLDGPAKKTDSIRWPEPSTVIVTMGDSNGLPRTKPCEFRIAFAPLAASINAIGDCDGRKFSGEYKRDLNDSLDHYINSID